MPVANISTQLMFDRAEEANHNDELAGRTDAIIHVGWLVTGEKTPEEIAAIQMENLDPSAYPRHYIRGYVFMWSEIYGLLF